MVSDIYSYVNTLKCNLVFQGDIPNKVLNCGSYSHYLMEFVAFTNQCFNSQLYSKVLHYFLLYMTSLYNMFKVNVMATWYGNINAPRRRLFYMGYVANIRIHNLVKDYWHMVTFVMSSWLHVFDRLCNSGLFFNYLSLKKLTLQ